MTTIDTITDSQIRALQHEAEAAGDIAMACLCRTACGDYEKATQTEMMAARHECVRVIRDAEAMADR
jgi:hypothetical protein